MAEQRWDPGLYDDRHAFVWKQGEALLEWLAPRRGERILDLGCGTGHLTARLAESGAEVIGLDSSPEMIEQARRAHPGLRFEVGDARDFAFDNPFDAVFSNAALHWVKEADRVAARVHSALRPGGRFVAELGGRGNVRALLAAVGEGARRVGVEPPAERWYFPSLGEYASLLERYGLGVSDAVLFDRPTPLEGAGGLRDWVRMFLGDFLAAIPDPSRELFLHHLEEAARPALYSGGTWHADYRRLRVLAWRAGGPRRD